MGIAITINNTLGITHAEIELPDSGVVEVIGPNASGKTSLAICAQAVLSHEINPLGLSGPQAKRAYPNDRDEASTAHVELVSHVGNSAMWHPASGKLHARLEDAPFASRAAVGLVDFAGSKAAAVALEFQGALLPPADEVIAKVREHLANYIPAGDLKGVIEMLRERGWQPAQAVYAERAKQSKRQWSKITGRTYGVRVAADWQPEGWQADHDSLTREQAEAGVVDAREALADLHRIQAIGELELADAQQAKAALPGIESEIEAQQASLRELRGELAGLGIEQLEHNRDQAISKHRALQRDVAMTHACPKCEAPLMIEAGKIVAKSSKAIARRDSDMQSAQDEIAAYENELTARRVHVQQAESDIADVVERITKLSGRRHATAQQAARADMTLDTPERQAELAHAEQAVSEAGKVVEMVRAEAEAGRLRETIVRYSEIAKAIGPDGIRSKMLSTGMGRLNAGLGVLADVAGWPLVVGSLNGGITSDDRPIALCSESERWRAQASIQLTMAALTGSSAVVLDRADLLDGANRAGLARGLGRIVEKTGVAVLLCSTGEPSNDAPWPQVAIKAGNIE